MILKETVVAQTLRASTTTCAIKKCSRHDDNVAAVCSLWRHIAYARRFKEIVMRQITSIGMVKKQVACAKMAISIIVQLCVLSILTTTVCTEINCRSISLRLTLLRSTSYNIPHYFCYFNMVYKMWKKTKQCLY